MTAGVGQNVVDSLGKKDLNSDGNIINLAIVGSSRFYDYSVFESLIEDWTDSHGYPDLIIVGGASGVDYMAERWANNNYIPIAIFTEEWSNSRRSLKDRGRPEAPNTLTDKILASATDILAIPSKTSKWTRIVIDMANARGIPITIHEVD